VRMPLPHPIPGTPQQPLKPTICSSLESSLLVSPTAPVYPAPGQRALPMLVPNDRARLVARAT
jgi:hypothetical protein